MKRAKSSLTSVLLGISLLLFLFSTILVLIGSVAQDEKRVGEQPKNLFSMDKDPSYLNLSDSFLIAGGGGGEKSENVKDLEIGNFRWGLKSIHAPQAWKITQGSEQIKVAVIDSGIDYEHPALQGKIWTNEDEIPGNGKDDDHNGYIDDNHGWDFRDNDNSSLKGTPIHWHGTFVTGLIGAAIDQSGRAGVAPQVKLMDVRFLDSRNRFYNSDWDRFAEAIEYAVDNGADIINLSIYANYKPPQVLKEAIGRADKRGVVIVGIAGNSSSHVQYPGRYKSVIATTAIDISNRLANYSNFGPEVTVAAPGDRVVSIIPDGKYTSGKGTSFAAPHVAGMTALLLSINPDLNFEQVLQILEKSSMDLGKPGRDDKFGYGLIDTNQALKHIFPNHKNTDAELNLELVGDSKNIPLDLDKDGFYEDINGDGTLTDEDPAILGFNLDSLEVIKNWWAFDFNNDGALDFKDVQTLKEMVKAERD